MLPYLFAAAHQNYSTWITQHLRDMQHLPATAKDDLLAGSHVKSLDEMYIDAEELEKTMKPNRHKEEGMRVLWENSHPLTTETATPYHIINGQVADGWGECARCTEDRAGHEHTFLFITSWWISSTHLK